MADLTYIVASTDFIGENNIQLKDLNGDNLTWFIEKYETLFLKEMLGADLYASYVADSTTDRFKALIPMLKPAIVDYVYWFYVADDAIQYMGTGTGVANNENSVSVNPTQKMIRAWSEMVEINKVNNKYLVDNADTWPEYKTPLPDWFFVPRCCETGILFSFYPFFDYSYYLVYGYACIPSIYRVKNQLGL